MAEFRITDFLKKQPQAITSKKQEPIINADSYSKEPVAITNKINNEISIGDKIKIAPYYINKYVGMAKYIGKVAEVIKISSREVDVEGAARNIICLWIKYPEENRLFMVSPMGYEKV